MNFDQPNCQVGDVGVRILLTLVDQDGNAIDISTGTSLTIKVEYPDGTSVDKTALLYSGGVDGKLYYDTIANDLSQAGQYFVQGEVTIGGKTKNSARGLFNVNSNIDNN